MKPSAGIAGRPFPGGSYTVEAADNEALWNVLGGRPPAPDAVHPLFGLLAPLVGCGLGIDEITAAGDAHISEGPMLATVDLDFRAPLRVDERYDISGEFLAMERKHGRRAGPFDLLRFELRVASADGRLAVVCTQSWILPRPNG